MTTTIDLFQFTKPVQNTHRFMCNEQMYRRIIEEVIDGMDCPNDYENGGWFEIREDGYRIEIEFEYTAYWSADWQHFDWGYEDLGDWEVSELTDLHCIYCAKNGIELELDEQRIIQEINKYFSQ